MFLISNVTNKRLSVREHCVWESAICRSLQREFQNRHTWFLYRDVLCVLLAVIMLQHDRVVLCSKLLQTCKVACSLTESMYYWQNAVYSMPIYSKKSLLFSSLQVKSTSIGWSLGYMLTMSNMIPSEVKKIPPMTNPIFAALIFLFSALTIVTVVLIFITFIRTCYWECMIQRE